MDQHQQTSRHPKSSLTSETSHWTSSSLDSVPLQSSSRLQTLISKWKAKFTFIWKEDFGPLSNSPVVFLHSPGKTLLTLSLVQKWLGSLFLGSLFLKSSERGDSWCTDSSFSSLPVKLSQVFESALLDSILKLAVIPVACAHFPTQFLPVNFAFNILWYSTPWTATPFSNDSLWLTLFVEGVNVRLLDHCQVSSLPHYCGFKEQEIPELILYGWSFIETQM